MSESNDEIVLSSTGEALQSLEVSVALPEKRKAEPIIESKQSKTSLEATRRLMNTFNKNNESSQSLKKKESFSYTQ